MRYLLLFFCNLFITGIVPGQVIHVPGDFPTIQLGINSANPGDTVLVAEGIYFEQISFLGKKPLCVSSEFIFDEDPGHITRTIIDGSRAADKTNASVVYFINNEDSTSIICGFTIQHGQGTYTPDNMDDMQGGGIWISDAGAKIKHNRITHNTLDDTWLSKGAGTSGAGIGTKWAGGDYWLVIESNTIDSNTCISDKEYAWGGGIASSYNTRISNNVISNNSCIGILNGTAQGGGIGCGQDPSWETPALIILENNIIRNNSVCSQYNWANSGAAIISDVRVVFTGNKVLFNSSETGTKAGGVSGLYLYQASAGSTVSNNIFEGNSSNWWGGALGMQNDEFQNNLVLVENNYFIRNRARNGAAFLCFNVPVKLQNNIFSGNTAEQGGAVFLLKNYDFPVPHMAILINNSFSDNIATVRGGAIYSLHCSPLIINSIFWDDIAPDGQEIFADTVEIGYSTISPEYITGSVISGSSNLNENPLFNDPELLTISIPNSCENMGTVTFTCQCGQSFLCPEDDITGSARPQGNSVDKGAYEYNVVCLAIRTDELSMQCFPNPFSTSTTIEYILPDPATVVLSIYGSFGQLLDEPINGYREKGKQRIEWAGKGLAPGIYYCRLQAGNERVTGMITKMK